MKGHLHARRPSLLLIEHSLSTRFGSNPNLSLNFRKLYLQSPLVKMSATCSSVYMYSNRMVPLWTQSIKKWYLMSMCLLQSWNTRFSDSLMPLWLSQWTTVASSSHSNNPGSYLLSHTPSQAAMLTAMYSASAELNATDFCFLLNQETTLDAMLKQQHEVLFWSSH